MLRYLAISKPQMKRVRRRGFFSTSQGKSKRDTSITRRSWPLMKLTITECWCWESYQNLKLNNQNLKLPNRNLKMTVQNLKLTNQKTGIINFDIGTNILSWPAIFSWLDPIFPWTIKGQQSAIVSWNSISFVKTTTERLV